MYVAAKGGERAIRAAHRMLARARRGDPSVPPITERQVGEQLSLSVARVMAEGSLYDPALAALAIRQARGDLVEAIFLVRAFRTTLARFGHCEPIDTGAMAPVRRISATFKDLPGGQILGPTFDYTHRLVDFALAAEAEAAAATAPSPDEETASPSGAAGEDEAAPRDARAGEPAAARVPRVTELLGAEALIEPADGNGPDEPRRDPGDLTREPLAFPAARDVRLQALARADEGFLLALAYSTQRGYAGTHAFTGEIRVGLVAVELFLPELGFCVEIGEIEVTEVESVNQFTGTRTAPAQFTRGYGLVFGHAERKAMAMALVDRALRRPELGEDPTGAPAEDAEFVLSHADNVQATGFLEHLKLPHYVDFQAELALVRRLRADAEEKSAAEGDPPADGTAEGNGR